MVNLRQITSVHLSGPGSYSFYRTMTSYIIIKFSSTRGSSSELFHRVIKAKNEHQSSLKSKEGYTIEKFSSQIYDTKKIRKIFIDNIAK